MRTLLRIDSSARRQGSHSRALAEYFQEVWARLHPDGQVIRRDLAERTPPHLDQEVILELGAAPGASSAAALSDELIAELKSADDVLISCPLYNFGLPSSLKAYLDHVVRSGHTFTYGSEGAIGLLSGKSAYILSARGGKSVPDVADDFIVPHLHTLLAFVGITSVESVVLDGTGEGAEHLLEITQQARERIDRLLDRRELQWIGAFTEGDRREIDALRSGQARAIVSGDAERYADLCADDIQLMIPGHDIISGRNRFFEVENKLLNGAKFESFTKRPQWIELQGDLAVEVGCQSVGVTAEAEKGDVFIPDQKYTHVFRRTPRGWRFAVLMSNSCK